MMPFKRLTIPLCDIVRTQSLEDMVKSNNIQLEIEVKVKKESEGEEEESSEEEEIKPVKKKTVVVKLKSEGKEIKNKESSSEDEEIKNEESSSEEEEKEDKRKTKTSGAANLSAYEKLIEKKRAESMAFLRSLKLDEAKTDLAEIVNSAKKKKTQPAKRKQLEKEKSPPVLRKSRRLIMRNSNSRDLSEDALYHNAIKAAEEEIEESKKKIVPCDLSWQYDSKYYRRARKRGFRHRMQRYMNKGMRSCETESWWILNKFIPPEMPFKDALECEEFYETYVKDVSIQESKSETKFFSYDKSVLSKMTLSESNIAKVTPDRITALAWYPSAEQLIITAGSKYGNLGIWNVDSDSTPYLFKTHYEGTTNLKFSPFNHIQLFSSSYDGTLRCGDLEKHIFSEIYNISDESSCTYFDFLSATTYLVSQKNGKVALVDKRTEGKSYEKRHTCHDYSVKTVNVHPVKKNFFVTAENRGSIRLWDLRKLQKDPVADITHHSRCVQSAFFSPITGNSILATSADDSISIFDSTNLTEDIKLKQHMKHDNFTGRWLSVFRATWLPNSEEAFFVGSMQHPRRIEVYDKNMFIYCLMKSENMNTVSSTIACNPMRPAVAGGNSSGKVSVFT